MTLDLSAIAEAARAATPGPWRDAPEQRSPNWSIVHTGEPDGPGQTVAQWALPPDAHHIATLSPDVALALVDRIRELEAGLREMCSLAETHLRGDDRFGPSYFEKRMADIDRLRQLADGTVKG